MSPNPSTGSLPGRVQARVWVSVWFTFGDIHNQNHHIDDLCTSNDGPDEGGMARAVHQRELDTVKPSHGQRSWCWCLHTKKRGSRRVWAAFSLELNIDRK